MFYMQYKGREKAAKVVNFVAKWLNLCLSTVPSWFFFTWITLFLDKMYFCLSISISFNDFFGAVEMLACEMD